MPRLPGPVVAPLPGRPDRRRPDAPRVVRLLVGLVLALTVLPVLGVTPATAADEAAEPLTLTLDEVSPQIPARGSVRVSGTITNTDDVTWTTINLYPFVGTEPITTAAGLAAASETALDEVVGEREASRGPYQVIDRLDPGDTVSYSFRVPVRRLALTGQGVYWFGVHALGQDDVGRDDVADGRVRTFLPRVVDDTASVPVAVVLQLRRRVRYDTDGSVARLDTWTSSLDPDGRLGRLLRMAEGAGSSGVTWVVDPAVTDALTRLAAGNPPRSTAPTLTPEELDEATESPDASASPTPAQPQPTDEDDVAQEEPSGSASPSDEDSAPEEDEPELDAATQAAADAAADYLARLQVLADQGQEFLSLPYGDLDVAAAALRGRPGNRTVADPRQSTAADPSASVSPSASASASSSSSSSATSTPEPGETVTVEPDEDATDEPTDGPSDEPTDDPAARTAASYVPTTGQDWFDAARFRAGNLLAGTTTRTMPVVAPPGGYLSGRALRLLGNRETVLLTDDAVRDEGLRTDGVAPTTVSVAGNRVVLSASAVLDGGPDSDDRPSTLSLRQRLLSEAAVRSATVAGEDSEAVQPLVVVLPAWFTPEDPDTFLAQLDLPWTDPDALTEATVGGGGTALRRSALVYGRAAASAQIEAGVFTYAQRLAAAGAGLQDLLTYNDQVGSDVLDEALTDLGYGWRRRQTAISRAAFASTVRLRSSIGGVTISGPPGVTLSSATGRFSATVENTLDEAVTVQVTASTDADLAVDQPDAVTVAAGGSATILLDATALTQGVHTVRLVLVDAAGTPTGATVTVPVRAAAVSDVIWLVMGSGVVLLFGAIAVRLFRRVRRARATAREARAAGAAPAGTDHASQDRADEADQDQTDEHDQQDGPA
ncbi:DUF6049 family protein [Nocardioides bruguierae]|uniref:DUF6049 family protein n=1 Tax=Nocardioides bruguierae TaxID=2945102 RepID=UPI0020215B93|nr:DUF6049 family protein [Nocardioides bruguierae]MCL8026699.1 DUF6049 family protein [Nocardioides bruguierae]